MANRKVKATTILTPQQVSIVREGIEGLLGSKVVSAFREYRLDTESILRFMSVGAKLRELRETKALELKAVAVHLCVPQYRLREIESSSINNIVGDVVLRYAEFLGANRWLKSWCSMNRSLAEKLGLIQGRAKSANAGAARELTAPSKRTSRKRRAVHGER